MGQFVEGCIAAGCDYLRNVHAVEINRAFMFVKAGTLFEELKKKNQYQRNYEVLFKKAVAVFMHQTVFNPTKLQVQPLTQWDENPDRELQDYCGTYPYYFINLSPDRIDNSAFLIFYFYYMALIYRVCRCFNKPVFHRVNIYKNFLQLK